MDTSGSGVDAADKLPPDERAELDGYFDREEAGERLSEAEETRMRVLMVKASPDPSPELRKKLEQHNRHFAMAYADINAGNLEAVEDFLEELAPPPRAGIERLERHINFALRLSTQRPRTDAPCRSTRPRAARPRGRRAVSRARARAPGRSADGDPEPPLAKRRP